MSVATKGRSLELYFIDGNPDGMLTAEVFNWTGHVLMAPRQQLKAALLRKEAGHTGLYLLLGESDGRDTLYIGEAEDVAVRIKNHDLRKPWWSRLVIITSSADNLHKAHVKYLESRLIETARAVAAVALENAHTPARSSLSEPGQANMEEFLETLHMVLPALGLSMFANKRRPERPEMPTLHEDAPIFRLATRRHGIVASARPQGAEFIVLKGSSCCPVWASDHGRLGYGALHADLVGSGVIDASSDPAVFTENYAFNSPSAAAAVIGGRPANGRTDWKLDSGMTLAEFEARQLNSEAETEQ